MSWCMLINTTPKYMQIVEVQITCIRRYAPRLSSVPIFLATELTSLDECVHRILQLENVHLIQLQNNEAGFLESRVAALSYIPEYDFVLPLQDDFWLDRAPDIDEALSIIQSDPRVHSLRLMPSPGPSFHDVAYKGDWKILSKHDTYRFTFQATLWRISSYVEFLNLILSSALVEFTRLGFPKSEWSRYCIRSNVAENIKGQEIFYETCMKPDRLHLAIVRKHSKKNAVFMCPWPYRPTAVVQGSLEPWAKEFAMREGFDLEWN